MHKDNVSRKNPNFHQNPIVYASPEAFSHFSNENNVMKLIKDVGLILHSLYSYCPDIFIYNNFLKKL